MHELNASSEPSRLLRPTVCVALVVLVWLALYLPGLWSPPLLDDADSVHAEAAREMMLRHDWSTLYIDGLRYLEKAPLLYWGMAASYELFGATDWAARLPLALAMLALLLATFAIGHFHFDAAAGLYAALALGLSFGPYLYTRILIPDILVALWLTLGLHCFLLTLGQARPSLAACWGLAAATALNVLTKGLIGIVFPVLIIVVYLRSPAICVICCACGPSPAWRSFSPWPRPGTSSPDCVTRPPARPKASSGFISSTNIFCATSTSAFRATMTRCRCCSSGPWRCCFCCRGRPSPSRHWPRCPVTGAGGARLTAVGEPCCCGPSPSVAVIGFFSFSSRQEYYVLPVLPALALILGAWLSQEQRSPADSPLRRAGQRIALASFAVALPVALAAWGLLWFSQRVPPNSELADLLTRNPSEYALSFGHIFDLTPRATGLFRPELLLIGAAFFFGTLASWGLRRRNRAGAANAALALMMLISLQCVHAALVTFSPVLSSRALSDALTRVTAPAT